MLSAEKAAPGTPLPVIATLAHHLRETLDLTTLISETDITACLAHIVATASSRERWMRAFASPLGKALMAAGRDLNTTLGAVLAALPVARN